MSPRVVDSKEALAGYKKFVSPEDYAKLKTLFAELDRAGSGPNGQAAADKIAKVLKKYY